MSIPNETIASLEAVLFACGGPVEAVRFGFVDVFRENEDTLWLSLVKE